MNPYSFKVPQTVEFGLGSLSNIPDILHDEESNSVFLVSDRGLESIGVVDRVAGIIENAGISCTAFLDVLPNPTVEMVEKAAALFKQSGASSIVALGGGSPIDVAKAIGVLATFGGKITDYEGADKVPGRILPLLAIPTTAGTGSEATASAVITDRRRNCKFSVISYNILPTHAILDPELIMTAPASVAASCGIDAFIHAMEAYLSRQASPFTDAMAEKAMELIGGNLRRFVANRSNPEAASAMMVGSNLAGIAFAWARLGNIHALSHPVSAYFGVAHGVANAILMPHVVAFNALADSGRYEKIYTFIRKGHGPVESFTPEMLVKELEALNRELRIPACLSEVGVTDEHFDAMAADAMNTVNVVANPRATTHKDLVALYNQAL